MRLARRLSEVVATMLVVGLLAAILVIACPEGVHLALSRTMDGHCVVMTHSGGPAATLASESARTLVGQVAALAAVPALHAFNTDVAASVVSRGSWSGIPPDPLRGRLRI
jgi:hypothetical protein